MSAWEEDKKGNFGGDGPQRRLLSAIASHDLEIWKELFSGNRNPDKSSMREHDPETGNTRADRGRRAEPAVELVRIIVCVNLSGPVDSQSFPRMSGLLSGYQIPEVFEYVGIAGDTSGNVLTYQLNVLDPENFYR
ncbi:hypothetical protein CHU98_g10167 [Xylaria longipes]|nr:hypothetical protein CHU98_g10167 [Xylaria longipes]